MSTLHHASFDGAGYDDPSDPDPDDATGEQENSGEFTADHNPLESEDTAADEPEPLVLKPAGDNTPQWLWDKEYNQGRDSSVTM